MSDPTILELTLEAAPESIPVARRAVAALLERRDVRPELAGDVSTALSEAAMNAVLHAYPDGGGEFQVRTSLDASRLDLEVRDWGSGVRPRLEGSAPGLRIGLSLISAVSDEFELRSGPRTGTLVRVSFDLERDREPEAPPREAPPRVEQETVMTVVSNDGVAPSVSSALAMLAGQVEMSVDRVADVQVIGDLIGAAASRFGEVPVQIRVRRLERGLAIRVGPFERGEASRFAAGGALPELGNAFERLSSGWRVEPDGEGESLVIEVGEAGAA